MLPTNSREICVLGLWHLGLVSLASLSEFGFKVVGFDPNIQLLSGLNRGDLPLFEPGLEALLKKHTADSSVRFVSDFKSAVSNAETILITFDTPLHEDDSIDLTILDATIHSIAQHLKNGVLIIVNSQVPVGTCERWQKSIESARPNCGIDLVYSPENLRLGNAIELFKKPDMIVIGYESESAKQKAERFFQVFESPKFFVSLRTAEMFKHALNGLLATTISFANELGNLCDVYGADAITISELLRKDRRVGKKAQVRPGLGFAGGTLGRDLKVLQALGKEADLPTDLVDSVLKINNKQIALVPKILEQYFGGNLRGKVIALFGATYKAGTSTLRRSATLEIMNLFDRMGVAFKVHDPKANLEEYRGTLKFEIDRDPYRVSEGTSAVIVLTDWPEFKDYDFQKIKKSMIFPLIFDVKSFLDLKKLKQLGFHCLEIGRGQLYEVHTS